MRITDESFLEIVCVAKKKSQKFLAAKNSPQCSTQLLVAKCAAEESMGGQRETIGSHTLVMPSGPKPSLTGVLARNWPKKNDGNILRKILPMKWLK